MSALADLMDEIVARLENSEPYAHLDRPPFTIAYRHRTNESTDAPGETGMRRFDLILVRCEPEPAGTVARKRARAELALRTLYPLADNKGLAARYFSEESALIHDLAIDPTLWADGRVRMIAYQEGRIVSTKGRWLMFEHRLDVLVDDVSGTGEPT